MTNTTNPETVRPVPTADTLAWFPIVGGSGGTVIAIEAIARIDGPRAAFLVQKHWSDGRTTTVATSGPLASAGEAVALANDEAGWTV